MVLRNQQTGVPRMAEPFAGRSAGPLDLTRFAPVEAASSSLPATFRKENTILTDGVSFCDRPQVLLFALPHTARKGECEGGTFAGFPTRVQSSARRRSLLRSKSAAPKKKRHTFVCLFFFVIVHRFCCLHSRTSQGRGSVRGEPLTGSPTRVQSPARRRATRLELASRHPTNGCRHSQEPCLTS